MTMTTPLLAGLTYLLATNHQKQQTSCVPSNVFVGGLGYAGTKIASEFHTAFPECRISGTVRSEERREMLVASSPPWLTGDVHVLDIDNHYTGLDSTGMEDLLAADTIIQTVAPICDFDTDPLLTFHGEVLRASSTALTYVAYISSTGVYGDHNGNWVTEDSELLCTDAKSRARIQAEREWGKLEDKDKTRVDFFRCGGIYGPGRGPLFSSLQSLTDALAEEPENEGNEGEEQTIVTKYVNRILVDDIAGAILTARTGIRPFRSGGRAYNLVDDDPAPRKAVVAEARRLLLSTRNEETPSPSKVASKNTRKRKSRGTGNKRCNNTRLKTEYSWKPKAPTFREGMAALLQTGLLS